MAYLLFYFAIKIEEHNHMSHRTSVCLDLNASISCNILRTEYNKTDYLCFNAAKLLDIDGEVYVS